MRNDRSDYNLLRSEWRSACEDHWRQMADPDAAPGNRARIAQRLAALSVKLHLMEKGRRSKR